MTAFEHLTDIRRISGCRRVVAFLHASSGSASGFRKLASHMQSGARYVAFAATEPGDRCSVAAIANIYWRQLQQILREEQPAELVLVGWSFGGVLAAEIAGLAESEGQAAAQVVLLDAATPELLRRRRNSDQVTAREVAEIFGITDDLPEIPLGDDSLAAAILDRLPQGQHDLRTSDLMPYIRVHRWHVRALYAPWRPRPCSAQVALIRARDEECWDDEPEDLGWAPVLGRTVRLLHAPGTHHTLLAEEHVSRLARTIDQIIGQACDGVTPAAEPDVGLPLSSPQARLWFLWELEPDGAHYTTQFGWRIPATTTAELRDAWRRLCDRHAMLRSTYRTTAAGEPRRFIEDSAAVQLTRIRDAVSSTELAELAAEQFRTPFDLRRGSARAVIADDGRRGAYLLVCCHHIAVDGWCMQVIEKDLRSLLGRPDVQLPALSADYQDFVAWERALCNSSSYASQLAYWTDVLKDSEVTPPPADLFEDAAAGAESLQFHIPAETVHSLKRSAVEAGVTLFATMLTCISVALREWARTSGIAIGVNLLNRPDPELEDVVGLFVDPVCLWLTPPSQGTFSQFVAHVWDRMIGAFDNSSVPYQDVVEAVVPKNRDPWNPLFWVIVNMDPPFSSAQSGKWEPIPSVVPPDAKFAFAVLLRLVDQEVEVEFLYPRNRYRPSTIAEVRGRFEQLINCIAQSGLGINLPPSRNFPTSSGKAFARFSMLHAKSRETRLGQGS